VDRPIKTNERITRKIKIYLCQKITGKKLDHAGAHFGISGAGVSQTARRSARLLGNDRELAKKLKKIEEKISKVKSYPYWRPTDETTQTYLIKIYS
jgi:hypothetical protein